MPEEACLCPEGSEHPYHVDCCDEDAFYAQGIGDIWTKKVEPLDPDQS